MLKELANICIKFSNRFHKPAIKGNSSSASGSKLPTPLSIFDQPNRIYRPLRAYSVNQATPRTFATTTKSRVLKAHTKNYTLVQMRKLCNDCTSAYPCRSRTTWKSILLNRRKISTKMSMSIEDSGAAGKRHGRPNKMIPSKNIAAIDDLIKKRKRLMTNKHWFAKPEDVRYKILYVKTSDPKQSPQVIEQPPIMALKKRFQAERILKARQENGGDAPKPNQIEQAELAALRRSIVQSNSHPKRRYERVLPRGRNRSHLYKERVQPPVISYAECMRRNDWGTARHAHSQAKLKEKPKQLVYESVQHHFKLRKDNDRNLVPEFEGPAAVQTTTVKVPPKPLMVRTAPSTMKMLAPRYDIRAKAHLQGRYFPEQTRVAQLSATSYSNATRMHQLKDPKTKAKRLPHMEPKTRLTSPKYVPPPIREFDDIPASAKRSYFRLPTTGRKTSMNTLRANTI